MNKNQIFYSEKLNTDAITAKHLFEGLGLNEPQYTKRVKNWFTYKCMWKDSSYTLPIEGKHYSSRSQSKKSKGDFTQNYDIALEFAKWIVINSNSQLKDEYVAWLLELERQKENLELLTKDQMVFIMQMIQAFKYIDRQKKVVEDHSLKYVYERANTGRSKSHLFAMFHQFRNSKLDITKEDVAERLKEYCIENGKSLEMLKKPKFTQIFTMDNYETLKHAIWDFLKVNNKDRYADRIANLAYGIAKDLEIDIFPKNENNLFQVKERILLDEKMIHKRIKN